RAARQPRTLGSPSRGRWQRLLGRKASFDQVLEFAGVDVVLVSTSVSASDDLHSGFQRLLDAGQVVRIQLTATLPHVWGTALAMEDVNRERRDKEGAILGHHGEEFRVLIEVTAVLDGVHPGFDSHT